jgi:hypothetical protein
MFKATRIAAKRVIAQAYLEKDDVLELEPDCKENLFILEKQTLTSLI